MAKLFGENPSFISYMDDLIVVDSDLVHKKIFFFLKLHFLKFITRLQDKLTMRFIYQSIALSLEIAAKI